MAMRFLICYKDILWKCQNKHSVVLQVFGSIESCTKFKSICFD